MTKFIAFFDDGDGHRDFSKICDTKEELYECIRRIFKNNDIEILTEFAVQDFEEEKNKKINIDTIDIQELISIFYEYITSFKNNNLTWTSSFRTELR